MKVWIEFPEDTRFARQPRDILYTPIYFANEKITGHIRLDKEWQTTYGDNLDEQFTARIKLIGKASLGFLSIGGKPVSGIDMRYAIPSLGFKPIYTLEILNVLKRVGLAGLEYEAEDGVRGGRVPFSFQLPSSTLEDLQQLASSCKVITADNQSTMGFLRGMTPALIVNVQYILVAEILSENSQVAQSSKEEIRIFVSLSEEQVPTSASSIVTSNPLATFVTTQVFPVNTVRGRRGSIPLIRRLSRASSQESNHMTIDVEKVEPFTFTRHSDAAATKATISLLYSTDSTSAETPPTIFATIQWMMKTHTTLTLEPLPEHTEQDDDYFYLRSKVLPSRKLTARWSDWQRQPATEEGRTRWKSSQDVWLIKDITAGMTPTFITPYLSHTYALNLQVSIGESSGRSLSSGKQKIELDVPVQVRYDLGLVPSYEIDESLPEYDHTLPEYEELEGTTNTDVDAEANNMPDLSTLNLDLETSQDNAEGDALPARQLARSPASSPRQIGSNQ